MIYIKFVLFFCVFGGVYNEDGNIDDVLLHVVALQEPRNVSGASVASEVVKVQLFYESLCPDCRQFDANAFKKTVLDLEPHLDVHLYPYGNARTIANADGSYSFVCQHGPAECYGNKLHACAIRHLRHNSDALLFNSCLMDASQAGRGSDDAAADVCGRSMSMDSEAIKTCAKSALADQLLKAYGDESKAAGFKYVPYVLVNSAVMKEDDDFKTVVCGAFKNPPPPCKAYN